VSFTISLSGGSLVTRGTLADTRESIIFSCWARFISSIRSTLFLAMVMGSMGKEDCSVRGHLRLFTILTISAFFGEGVGFETGVGAMRLAATSIFACLGGVGLGYTAPTPPQRRCLYSSRFSFRFAGGVKVGVVVERVGGAIGFAAHTDNAASLSCFRSERFFPPNPRPVH